MNDKMYDILYMLFDVKRGETNESDLKSSYRRIANQFHPDKNAEINPNVFIALSKGYELIKSDMDKDNENNYKTGEDNSYQRKQSQKGPFDFDENDFKIFAAEKLAGIFQNGIFNSLNNDIFTININKKIKDIIEHESENCRRRNKKIRKQMEIIEKVKKKFDIKDDRISLISMLDDMIRTKEIRIRENKNIIEINKLIIEILNNYKYNFDKKEKK